VRCELISWSRVNQLARRLAQLIRRDGFQSDIVVAIARGGYVPARLLCDLLDIYDLTSIRVMHYTAGSQKREKARLYMPLAVDVRGKKVLLVDDVTDSGDTLQLALQHIRECGAAEIRVAVLQHKQVSSIIPDFYAHKVVRWRWLIYPWAVVEDISGFISAMEPHPVTPAEAAARLQQAYGIKVTGQVLEDAFVLMRGEGQ
jgi:hypoxanthine phosphoribosyltransferase